MRRFLLLIVLLTQSIIGYTQISGGNFTSTSCTAGDLSWTNPGGVNTIIIFAKAGNITVGTPSTNISTYTANSTFGSGTAYQHDAAAFCIYKATSGTSVSLTGLTPGVSYEFLAFDANGTTYSASHVFTGTTPGVVNPSAFVAHSEDGQINLSWSNPTCVEEVMVVAKTSSITASPSGNGSLYTANASFIGSGTAFDGSGKVVYEGTGTSVIVTDLTNSNPYFFKIFTRVGSVWSTGTELSATPLAPVTAGAFNTDLCLTTGQVTWTNPSPLETILVFAKSGATPITVGSPTANISTYTDNANFGGAGTAYQHDAAAKCVYKGTGSSFNLTGLSAGTQYQFLIFNATGTSYSPAETFNGSTLTSPPNASGLSTTPAGTSISFSWTNPSSCYDQMMVVVKTTTISGTPTGDGTSYNADANFSGSGTVFNGSGKVVFKGTGNSVNVTGLTAGNTYFLKVFTKLGSTWSAGIETSALTVCVPDNVTALKISDAANTANLYWTNPSCFDEVMIVAKQGTASTPATITLAPTGTGGSYSPNANFSAGGTAFDGGKVVYKDGTNPGPSGFQVTNLTTGLIYTFKVFTKKGTTWSAGSVITTVPGPPVLLSIDPADGSSDVSSDQVFNVTFNERIFISGTSASGDEDEIVFDGGSDPSIPRGSTSGSPSGDGVISRNGKVATLVLDNDLGLGLTYNVLIGNKVFRDSTGTNFGGTVAGNWNFTVSEGSIITAPTVGTCVNQFATLGDIIIEENANNNFQGTDNGSFTLVLGFDKTGYIFNPGTAGVTATLLAGGDIQSITVTSVTFTQATFTIQFADVSGNPQARDNKDRITISGLKVSRDGSSAPPAIVVAATATTLPMQGITEGSTVLGTINGGTASSVPTVAWPNSNDNSYCISTNLNTLTITASGGSNYKWYNDALLTSNIGALNGVATPTAAQLGFSSASSGTFTKYVTSSSTGCESAATEVTLIITPNPVADAGITQTICPGANFVLGGTPTLQTPSIAGTYTYDWSSPDVTGFTASGSNPSVVAPPNNNTFDADTVYNVLITDANGCTATDNVTIIIKGTSGGATFIQPGAFNYTINDTPITLEGSPSGGVFSGNGVVQTTVGGNTTYKFNPAATNVGSFPITYTVSINGCVQTTVRTFNVSTFTSVFTNMVSSEYCSGEDPVNLNISGTIIDDIEDYVTNYNANNPGLSQLVFRGFVRNYNNYSYGQDSDGNVNNDELTYTETTYTHNGKSYELYQFHPQAFFNGSPNLPNYPGCPTCNTGYILIIIEFVNPNIPNTSNSYPYNIPLNYDDGYFFNINFGGSIGRKAGFYYNYQYFTVNEVPDLSINGLVSGLVNPSVFCETNTDYTISGSSSVVDFNGVPTPAGSFAINDGSGFTQGAGTGLINNNNTAIFNPQTAHGSSSSNPHSIVVRYTQDTGRNGSTGQNCERSVTETINIRESDLQSFTFPASPPAIPTYCYEGASVLLDTDRGNSGGGNVQWLANGGVSANPGTDGSALLNPKAAFDAVGGTIPVDATVTARYTNAFGCITETNKVIRIFPKPTSNFNITPNDPKLCYSDPTVQFTGNNPSGSTYEFVIDYIGRSWSDTISSATTDFDPSVYFDQFVLRGGAAESDASFNVTYVVTDGIGCTSSATKLVEVSPSVKVSVSGFNNGDKFCSNEPNQRIQFSPVGTSTTASVTVNGSVPFPGLDPTNSLYSANLSPGVNTIQYTYLSGASQCPNTLDVPLTITKVQAPSANFTTQAICNGDPVTYEASSANAATWQWIIVGDTIDGQTVPNYYFPKLGGSTSTTYDIKLFVTNETGAAKVCRDSLTRPQVIGAYPNIDFTYAKVCNGDITELNVTSPDVPIVTAKWVFGDGVFTPEGSLGATIPGSVANTDGTFQTPLHSFGANGRYSVKVVGYTDVNFGHCKDSVIHQVAILRRMTSSTFYSMKDENGGDGYWVEEDRSDSSTWQFALPRIAHVNPDSTKLLFDQSVGSAWITNPNGKYKAKDNSFVNSPCFDFTNFSKPVISIQYWNNSDLAKDGAVLQYSIDGGSSWEVIGTPSSGINWYSNTTISSAPGNHNEFGWTGRTQDRWLIGKNSLDEIANEPNVRFRIAFASDEREEYDGFAFNEVVIEERNRIMLIEHFSNTATQGSTSTLNFNNDGTLNDSEVVKVQYHTSFPAADEINAQNSADHNARAAFYGVTTQSVPIGFIDGGRDVLAPFGFPNNGWWQDYKQKRSLNASPYSSFSISKIPSGSPSKLAVHVIAEKTPEAELTGSNPVLYIAVIEKSVGANEYVLRKFLPDASGIKLTPTQEDIDITREWNVRGIANLSELAVVAFIQDEVTKEVYQATMDITNLNLPSSLVTKVEDHEYAKYVGLFPNPAHREVEITLPSAASKPTPVEIHDTFGRVMYQSVFKTGDTSLKVSTTNFANGVYLLQIITPQGNKAVKKIMVKH